MLRRLDRAAAGRTHFEVAALELEVGTARRHPHDHFVGGGGDVPLTRRHRHILFCINDRIVML